ncbi:MAG TPA: NlpC/P60 family protein [Bacillota bacterium]|nr:NlpC/P60 family protein [Bacillota bacterium]
MRLRFIRGLLISSMISSLIGTTAYAETLEELNKSLTNVNKQVSTASSQRDELKAETENLKQALESMDKEIKANKQSVETIQKQILQLNESIRKNQALLDQDELEFGKQAKVMYEEGESTFLDVLLEAKNFGDFLTRLDAFRMIATSNSNKITKMKALQQTIENEKADSQQKLQDVEQKQEELKTLKETKKILQKQKEAQIDQLDRTISSKKEEADRLQAKIDFEKREALFAKEHPILDDGGSFLRGTTYKGSAGSIISFASGFKGVPYAWGGTSPSGFDCSGFTQYVYRNAGVPLSRTAATQFQQGVPVSQSDLQPGDLVFFSTYGPGATHVGIYIGYNMMIDAADNGVTLSNITNSYWGSRYIGARRVLS